MNNAMQNEKRTREIAVLTINGEEAYRCNTGDEKDFAFIKEIARDHRDRRGHAVTLKRHVVVEERVWTTCPDGCCGSWDWN